MTDAAARSQLATEVAHWRLAADGLADLDAVASPTAWAGLESYTRLRLRERLLAVIAELSAEAARVQAAVAAGGEVAELRRRLLRLRQRYVQVETVIDFYGDAVNTRTNPRLAALLRGLDVIAADSLEVILRPLGVPVPPVLVYLDKGLGAAILRAGVRLWGAGNPSPIAAIKLTRHNLGYPTAICHEIGHQVDALTGWASELADALSGVLGRRSRELASIWSGWASELAADLHAFALAGWAPVPALANVVDGSTAAVYRMPPGDPHPYPMIRVLFNAALCRDWFGPGPWDLLARTWCERHPPSGADDAYRITRGSLDALGDIVEVCTRRPMDAFGGRPLHAVANPLLVSPTALGELARRAGPSLLTSQYLARREPLRILSWLVTKAGLDSSDAPIYRAHLHDWLTGLGTEPLARSA